MKQSAVSVAMILFPLFEPALAAGLYGGFGYGPSAGSFVLMADAAIPKTRGHVKVVGLTWSDDRASHRTAECESRGGIVTPLPPCQGEIASNTESTHNSALGFTYCGEPWGRKIRVGGCTGAVWVSRKTPNLNRQGNFIFGFSVRRGRLTFWPIVHLSTFGQQAGEDFAMLGWQLSLVH